jgi:hypothetical protein
MDTTLLTVRCAHAYDLYGRACDSHDIDALRSLATEDVELEVQGPRAHTGSGVEAYLALYRAHDTAVATRHVIGGVLVEQREFGICTNAHFQAFTFAATHTRITFGVYRNVYRDIDGTLLIARLNIDVQRHLDLPASRDVSSTAGAGP